MFRSEELPMTVHARLLLAKRSFPFCHIQPYEEFRVLPSNILLILVPLMPNLKLAVLVLLIRFSISQMDVPARQSYVMAVVNKEERSAAAGITGVARTTGAAISPLFVGFMFARPSWINVPFFIAGTLKILYDLLLYGEFVTVQPPEEQ